jgi:putative DNA primase/helicase
VTHLTRERGRSEGANSALATTKNKRFVVLQEPEAGEELKVGELKMLTGGDTVPVRDLYKKQEYIKPQFKMVLTCNQLPSVSSSDRGVWRRMSVVEFISVFTHEPDPKEKYQFKINESLGEKLQPDGPWVEPFIYLLTEYYRKYKVTGLREPAEVKKYTDEYKSESDNFIQFINEKIIEVDDSEQELRLDEIYFEYQNWFKQTKGITAKCPSRKDVKTNLTKKYGAKSNPNNRNGWIGLAIKDTAP